VKIGEIEEKILAAIQEAQADYGFEVHFLGVKKLGLPESITEKVIARMEAERRRVVSRLRGEGQEKSTVIRSEAERQRDQILAEAEAEAKRIRGEGYAEAAKFNSVFAQDKDLAIFLLELGALEASLREKSTLVLDPRTPPFNLLTGEELLERKSGR
jgi:membrane protease subunit HflC